MAMQRNGFHLDTAQVERLKQSAAKEAEARDLDIMELEERIGPLWNRRYPSV
jgi:hypothetical protein